MKRSVTLLLLVAAWIPPLASAITRAELPAHAQVVADDLAAHRDSAHLSALRAAVDDGTALQLVRREPAAFEPAASQLLQKLADEVPSEAQRDWVKSLVDHQPLLWQQHPETLSAWFIPVLDLAAQAAALQHHWEMQKQLASMLPKLERLATWSQAFIEAPEPLQARILQSLSPSSLDHLLQQPIPPGLGSLAWRALLQNQYRVQIWEQALKMAPDAAMRHSMHGVWQLDAHHARDWLERARSQRPALASIAVAVLGQDPDPGLRHARLFELLGTQDHQSAAAALASDTALTDAQLIEAFRAASGGRSQRALALSLRLRDSPATRRFLADWIETGPDNAALRESLR